MYIIFVILFLISGYKIIFVNTHQFITLLVIVNVCEDFYYAIYLKDMHQLVHIYFHYL